MSRINDFANFVVGKFIDWSYIGLALRAHSTGETTLEFQWPTNTADFWINAITSTGKWKVESITHPLVFDWETDDMKAVVRASFVRVDAEDPAGEASL